MTRRYSATEKAKWASEPAAPRRRTPVQIPDTSVPRRRAPIQIPDTDNSALIEQNKFTLIGRVSNPAAQNTRALVEFFLQHWQVSGSITGRALGPHLFQFRFESEKDLLSILNRAPYHFKRWMFLLQRWEPTVSETFPSLISFWVTVHGLPLHYWTDQALHAIGSDIGHVESKDATNGRFRVSINGLQPLERTLELSLPSGGVKEVELEYEKLEKHCFSCLSLSHESDDCPSAQAPNTQRSAPMGINQVRTLEKLTERRQASGRTDRMHAPPRPSRLAQQGRERGSDSAYPRHAPLGDDRHERRQHDYDPRHHHHRASTQREVWVPRKDAHSASPRSGGRCSDTRISERRTGGTPVTSHVSHTPPPRPAREPTHTPSAAISSSTLNSKERRSALERISPAGSLNVPNERQSALHRLSLPSNGIVVPQREDRNSGSANLQDVELHYFEDTMTDAPFVDKTGASSSKAQQAPASPIRTLSEDRRHVSLRLGPVPAESSPSEALPIASTVKRSSRIAAARLSGKRKMPTPPHSKITRSSTQGVAIKKRRITITHNSPRRKLIMQAEGKKTGPSSKAVPGSRVFPASTRKVTDFRSPQGSLP